MSTGFNLALPKDGFVVVHVVDVNRFSCIKLEAAVVDGVSLEVLQALGAHTTMLTGDQAWSPIIPSSMSTEYQLKFKAFKYILGTGQVIF